MSTTTKKYLISSLVTFFAAFSIYFITVIDTITLESISNGALAGIIFVGVRTGLKAILEMFILWYGSERK